jgi:hypothetical protein
MSKISFYKDTYDKNPFTLDVHDMIDAVRNGAYKEQTLRIRSIKDPVAYKREKAKMPAFTVSGTFKGKAADTLIEHSGFICMDFDNLGEDIDQARSQLYADPYTYAGFVSVGGHGLCLLVRIEPDRHADAFDALEKYYFNQYGYQCDLSVRNVNRLRFGSYDPDLYHNTEARIFRDYLKKPKGRPKKEKPIITTDDDFGYVLGQIQASRIDITSDYSDWVKIGHSIKSKYGDAGLEYYQAISQFHPDYDPIKTERKYRALGDTRSITISSFFYIAKRHNIEIATPKSKTIKQVAAFAKRGNRTPEQAAETLKTFDNIPLEESLPIINQVFSAPSNAVDNPDADEQIVQLIEDYIKRSYTIRFNEITKKYEIDAAPMTDVDYNTIYLDTRTILPKATKDLVKAVIQSNRTTNYNPIKDWFGRNARMNNPKGLIDALADCIESLTQSAEYKRKFIRYWMVGAVAMWHKYHSPLMLVLAGSRQNTGKSHFFRYLLPNELQPYYAESYLTGDKDENILMCSKIIIMNDEMSNKSKRDIAMIKDLCSKQWFNIRKPYGETAEDIRRIAALAGTSNDLALLADPSGNRRIVPINVFSINHDAYNSIDKADLWVEAYNAFKEGERFHLDKDDISMLDRHSTDFHEPSAEMEGFLAFFREPDEMEMPQFLTNTQIKSYIEIRTKQRLNSKKLGMELRKLGFNVIPKKINGSTQYTYAVSELSGVLVGKFIDAQG